MSLNSNMQESSELQRNKYDSLSIIGISGATTGAGIFRVGFWNRIVLAKSTRARLSMVSVASTGSGGYFIFIKKKNIFMDLG